MSAVGRDQRVREEAKMFAARKHNNPRPCQHHEPTLEELERTTFSDYVRNTVLKKAERRYEDGLVEEVPQNSKDIINQPPIHYNNGMAKVTLPKGFCDNTGIAKDETGRGADWEEGTPLGDFTIPSPIKQCVRGIGGIYEFTFLDQKSTTVAEFRTIADKYFDSQVGNQTDLSIEMLERKFWRRLGPTMQPSMYGADQDGTLFGDDGCLGWNISRLQSCLQLLLADQPDNHRGGIPGVTTPYLYFGMWASVFCAHTEDMNLLSINYLHAGAPKVWYAVAAGEDARRLEQLCEGHYHQAKTECTEYMRHKRALISPNVLKKAGISFTTTVQYPGDAMITFPGSYHFGFNTGFNVAEATNFAVPEWVPYGKLAQVCLCRPDSVRIDMKRFGKLLTQYEKEVKQRKRFPWKDWAKRLANKNKEDEAELEEDGETSKTKRKAFWVEVMQPCRTTRSKRNTGKSKDTKNSRKRSKKAAEIWHFAKPAGRKSLRPATKVLCIMPAVVDDKDVSSSDEDEEEDEDEQCFAGAIVEARDDHARIRLDGLTKKDDVWMSIDSPKLFLDGGRWGEEGTDESLPPLHYWREEDSKRRCT